MHRSFPSPPKSFRLSAIVLDDLIDGVSMPPMDPKITDLQEFIANVAPRLEGLRWVARNKPEAFAPSLFSFGLRRRNQVSDTPSLLPPGGWAVAMLIPAADRLRRHFGADWDPFAVPTTWPRILYEAIDDVVAALWHLRGGMTVSAALIARSLLERWTLNVAHEFGLARDQDEDDAAFISRVWRSYDDPSIDSGIGEWWGWLSELLHGRAGGPALGLDSDQSIDLDDPENERLHSSISRILELTLRQIRGGLSTLAKSEGLEDTIAVFQCRAPQVASTGEPFPLTLAFLPLEYYEAHRVRSEQWVQLAAVYRSSVEDDSWRLTTTFSPVMACEALLERRGRAVERARLAFENEKEQLAEDFNPGHLASKMFRFVSIAQMGRILAAKVSSHQRVALVTASHAVDGAAHLWLEDSDYSLGCIRVLLEQTARLRVHRLKPDRAARMEAFKTPSSRWISAAGWGRLAVLMRAVNEFAHIGMRTRRAGARRVLQRLQMSPDSPQTSRGDALMSVVYMLAFELHARLDGEPAIAAAFTATVTLLDEDAHLSRLESYLNNAHAWRDETFGAPDLVRADRSGAGMEP